MSPWIRVLVAGALAVAMGASAYVGNGPFAVAAAATVALLAYGWPRLTDSPQPRQTSVMLAVVGLAGLVAVWFVPRPPYLEWLPLIAGLALLWTFVQQLMRGLGASHAVTNISGQTGGVAIVLCVATWLASMKLPGDKEALLIGLLAIIVALAATALPWPARYTSPLAIVLASVAAVIAAFVIQGSVGPLVALGLGIFTGILVAAVDRLLGLAARTRFQSRDIEHAERRRDKARSLAVQLALGAAPVALAGVGVYVVERVVLFQ